MADKNMHARLIIFGLPFLKPKDQKRVADWLLAKSEEIRSAIPADYAPKYTSRLFK